MWFKLKAISTNETCYDAIACAADLALGLGLENFWRES